MINHLYLMVNNWIGKVYVSSEDRKASGEVFEGLGRCFEVGKYSLQRVYLFVNLRGCKLQGIYSNLSHWSKLRQDNYC